MPEPAGPPPAPRWARWGSFDRPRLGLAVLGATTIIYLIYVELFIVDAICLWCTSVHVIAFALFVVTLLEVGGRAARVEAAQVAAANQRRRGRPQATRR